MGIVASKACHCSSLSLKMKGFAIGLFFLCVCVCGGGGVWGIEPLTFPGQNTGIDLQRGLSVIMAILRLVL